MTDLDFLSSSDAARLLGISPRGLLFRVKALRIRGHDLGVKLGRDWVFREWEVGLMRDLAPLVGRPKRGER